MNIIDENIVNYQQIYLRYAPMMLHFAKKIVPQFVVEDLVHDVFLKIWGQQIFLLPDNEVKNILYSAVRNACIDLLRHSDREQKILEKRAVELKLEELNYLESFEAIFTQKDILTRVMKTLEKLPKRQREIIKLSYIEEIKTAEIATLLNISVRTVENHLYRALKTLQEHFIPIIICLFGF